jgi:hypothetical protein
MLMKRVASILHVVTAFVTGCWAIYLIGLPSVGGPWSWWYPIILAASILLLVGGVHMALPRLRRGWLVLIAAVFSILSWNLGTWLREALIFAGVMAATAWCVLALASLSKRAWVVSFIASLLLAVWWVPQSVRTLNAFFSPRSASVAPSGLLWALTPALLVVASLIAVALISRTTTASGNGHSYDAPE